MAGIITGFYIWYSARRGLETWGRGACAALRWSSPSCEGLMIVQVPSIMVEPSPSSSLLLNTSCALPRSVQRFTLSLLCFTILAPHWLRDSTPYCCIALGAWC